MVKRSGTLSSRCSDTICPDAAMRRGLVGEISRGKPLKSASFDFQLQIADRKLQILNCRLHMSNCRYQS